jgi:hypothetical protein
MRAAIGVLDSKREHGIPPKQQVRKRQHVAIA